MGGLIVADAAYVGAGLLGVFLTIFAFAVAATYRAEVRRGTHRLVRRSAAALRGAVAIVAAATPDLLIVGGVGSALAGLYLLLGLAVTLIVAGVGVAAYGVGLDLVRRPRFR